MKIIIIAEIGINHNGDIDLAKKMIKAAKDCGADLVKFQKRDINLVYSKEYLETYRESRMRRQFCCTAIGAHFYWL